MIIKLVTLGRFAAARSVKTVVVMQIARRKQRIGAAGFGCVCIFCYLCGVEALYQYAWKHRLYDAGDCRLTDGRCVRIVSPGVLNTDAGPDFSNAYMVVEGVTWRGNVEIHERASDWHHHRHDEDEAYDSVMLHVVAVDDCEVRRSDGSLVPQLVISVPHDVEVSYSAIAAGLDSVHCHRYIGRLSNLQRCEWFEALGVERMQSKAEHVAHIYEWSGHDWQQTCFAMLARGLGFGLNADPMEMLGRALPLNFAARHSDNTVQIEAMLFGLGGFLNPDLLYEDDYYQYLCGEYRFLAAKYHLRPVRGTLWKLARTRPQNFPHRRIAVLAQALSGGFTLMRDICNASSLETLQQLFDWELSGYWAEHFTFGSKATTPSRMGKASIDLLTINVAVPLLYAYGSMRGDREMTERAMELLCSLPAERNGVVRTWQMSGIEADNAFRSQALLHLRKAYCDAGRCMDCRFGQFFMREVYKSAVKPQETGDKRI